MLHPNARGRAFIASSLGSVLIAVSSCGLGGCGTNAKMTSESRERDWKSDSYVPPTDERTRSMNAARILSMPERDCDKTMQVGAVSAVIHEKPSASSRALAVVMAGSAVKVVREGDFLRIPDKMAMGEYVGDKGGDVTPTWVRVKSGSVEGWIPARALVKPLEYAASSESIVASGADEGTKGFSQKVKREATAMKGAAGTPKLKGANYAAADQILERMKSPMNFALPADAFVPVPRVTGVPVAGQPLQEVDPALAQQASAVTDKVLAPSDASKALDAGKGLLGQFGVKAADDPNAKLGIEVGKLVADLSEPLPVTPAEERVLGRECLAQVLGKSKVLPDSSPAACYVRWVGAKVAANSSLPYSSLGLDFLVIEDKSANAVAVPGGPVVITTGMLEFLENEHELAAILGHECAHVEERHGLRHAVDQGLGKLPRLMRFSDQQARGLLTPVVEEQLTKTGLPAPVAKEGAKQFVGMGNKLFQEVFESVVASIASGAFKGAWGDDSEGVETGADIRGLSLASAAGYDPAALDAVLERLKARTGEYGGGSYSESRAGCCNRFVALLPDADPAKAPAGSGGSPPAAAKTGTPAKPDAAPAPMRTVKPSKQQASRWSRLDAELRK